MQIGTPKFNGIALASGEFSFMDSPGVKLAAKAAFIDSNTGMTHGWTTATSIWSKETVALLDQLRASMEADLAAIHMAEASYGSALAVSGGETTTGSGRGPGGLLEHLGKEEDDARPI